MKKIIFIFLVVAVSISFFAGCGSAMNTHTGKYFTIDYPKDFKVESRDEGAILTREDKFGVVVIADKTKGIREGDINTVITHLEQIKEVMEVEKFPPQITEKLLDGIKSTFIKVVDEKNKKTAYGYLVPLDGACIFVMTSDMIDFADVQTANEMISSLKFTDKAFFSGK